MRTAFGRVFAGKRVFVTGHTGFKGSWLSLWLTELGAEVYGYSLEPPTQPSLFEEANLGDAITFHCIGDVRNSEALTQAVKRAQPEIGFMEGPPAELWQSGD